MLKTAKQIPEGGIIDIPKSSINYKTGTWKILKPIIDESKCIHCALCVLSCPENCINYTKDQKRGEINLDYCKGCRVCEKVCPVKCIKMESENK